MAIRWLKDIGIIKRILAEAETSARLIAIRSLELMLNTDALKVLEESHANAISFEKFFIEKAIDNIKEFNESGVVPIEIQKALEKQELLTKDSVNFKGFEIEGGYSDEPVQIGDLSSALSSHKSQESIESVENIPDSNSHNEKLDASDETNSSTVDLASSNDHGIESSKYEVDIDSLQSIQQSNNTSVLGDILPNDTLSSVETPDTVAELLDSSSVIAETEKEDVKLKSGNANAEISDPNEERVSSEANSSESELFDEYQVNDSYDDLLPSLGSSVTDDLDSYDDLLPPLEPLSHGEDQIGAFDSLLPPVEASTVDGIDKFDDLLGSPSAEASDNLEDDYKDLLPLESTDDLLDLPMEGDTQKVDYDDLLPPLGTSNVSNSNDYDDLLPPLNVGPTEYDDLLPPMSPDINSEDLLPPLKTDKEQNEDSADTYDDLLPPLK